MLGQLMKIAGQVAESVPSIVGIRIGTEEPKHSSEQLTDRVEVRRYAPRIAAEATVAADEEEARNQGFRLLAGYIFGKNQSDDSIAMTAPVAQAKAGQQIAMTAPVAQSAQHTDVGEGLGHQILHAVEVDDGIASRSPSMTASDWTEVPAETFAVLRFSGDRSPRAVAEHTAELEEVLRTKGIDRTGDATAWFYDPPWTVPFRRRNEIAIPVSA